MAVNEVTGSRPALRTTPTRTQSAPETVPPPTTTRTRPNQLRTGFTEETPRRTRTNTSEVEQPNAAQLAAANRNGYRDLDINLRPILPR